VLKLVQGICTQLLKTAGADNEISWKKEKPYGGGIHLPLVHPRLLSIIIAGFHLRSSNSKIINHKVV